MFSDENSSPQLLEEEILMCMRQAGGGNSSSYEGVEPNRWQIKTKQNKTTTALLHALRNKMVALEVVPLIDTLQEEIQFNIQQSYLASYLKNIHR